MITDVELYEILRQRGDIIEERVTFPEHKIILTLKNGIIEFEWNEEIKKVFLK